MKKLGQNGTPKVGSIHIHILLHTSRDHIMDE